jgi:hypothetical protein
MCDKSVVGELASFGKTEHAFREVGGRSADVSEYEIRESGPPETKLSHANNLCDCDRMSIRTKTGDDLISEARESPDRCWTIA